MFVKVILLSCFNIDTEMMTWYLHSVLKIMTDYLTVFCFISGPQVIFHHKINRCSAFWTGNDFVFLWCRDLWLISSVGQTLYFFKEQLILFSSLMTAWSSTNQNEIYVYNLKEQRISQKNLIQDKWSNRMQNFLL